MVQQIFVIEYSTNNCYASNLQIIHYVCSRVLRDSVLIFLPDLDLIVFVGQKIVIKMITISIKKWDLDF